MPSSREIFPTQGLDPHLLHLPALASGFFTTRTACEAPAKYNSMQNEALIIKFTASCLVWTLKNLFIWMVYSSRENCPFKGTPKLWASLIAQVVKNLPAMQETWVRSLVWEDPLERKEWQPTPVFLPGESHGQRSLVGLSPQGCRESDMTEWLTHTR